MRYDLPMRSSILSILALLVAISLTAQVRTVTRVGIVAKPRSYSGPCPVTLQFIGTIHVRRYPVWVEYEWERSDGARGRRERVEITSAGRGVSDTWHLGAGRQRMKVWERLHVLAPTGISSPAARVTVNCR
jgi:hypothetical protein